MTDNPPDRQSWLIGLDSWIIQDGNYPDFVTRAAVRSLDNP